MCFPSKQIKDMCSTTLGFFYATSVFTYHVKAKE